MPKRSRKKPKADENRAAFEVLQQVIKQTDGSGKNPMAVALGRVGGLKGGRVRSARMSKEERIASASKAAKARWGKKKDVVP